MVIAHFIFSNENGFKEEKESRFKISLEGKVIWENIEEDDEKK